MKEINYGIPLCVFVLEIKWNTSVVAINIKTAVLVSLEIRACFINKLSPPQKKKKSYFYYDFILYTK